MGQWYEMVQMDNIFVVLSRHLSMRLAETYSRENVFVLNLGKRHLKCGVTCTGFAAHQFSSLKCIRPEVIACLIE